MKWNEDHSEITRHLNPDANSVAKRPTSAAVIVAKIYNTHVGACMPGSFTILETIAHRHVLFSQVGSPIAAASAGVCHRLAE